jgi:Flp pilus assembly protein TadG
MAEGAPRGRPVKAPASDGNPRPRGRLRALRREEGGTALVEFALIAPFLFLLLFGIIDFGRALNYYNQVTQLAGQGARAAAVNTMPDGTTITSGTALQTALVNATGQPELKNGEIVCIKSPLPTAVGQPVTVKVSYQFHFLPLVGAAAGALGGLNLSATETERAEVVPAGGVSYAAGNQNGTPCS